MVLRIVLLITFLAMPLPFCFGQGQPDYHRITQRSNLSGSVSGLGGMVPIKGEAIVEYDERILERLATGEPVRTVRHYAKAKLVRDQAGQAGEGYLRAALNPIVILRQGTTEVPFSPRGPMTCSVPMFSLGPYRECFPHPGRNRAGLGWHPRRRFGN